MNILWYLESGSRRVTRRMLCPAAPKPSRRGWHGGTNRLTRRFRCWRTHSPTRRSDVPLGSFRKSHIRWITLRGGHMVDDVESCLTLDRRTTHLSRCANRSFLDFISSKMTKTSCPKSLVSMQARRLTERGIQARDWEIAGSAAPAPAPRSLPQQFPMRNKNGQPSCSDPLPISRAVEKRRKPQPRTGPTGLQLPFPSPLLSAHLHSFSPSHRATTSLALRL
jgi:hypothetical protein